MTSNTGKKFKQIAIELFNGRVGDLAHALGMHPGSFSKYTSGETIPGGKILRRLIALNININWFLADVPPMFISDFGQNPELNRLDNNELDALALRIKWVRLFYDKSIPEMASALDVTNKEQISIESGEHEVNQDYIQQFLKHFSDVNRSWLIDNEEPKLESLNKDNHKIQNNYFSDINEASLNQRETDLLDEVKQFSNFLETRPLNPHSKRILLEQLIQSIDQEIE